MRRRKCILSFALAIILAAQILIIPSSFAMDDQIKTQPADNAIGFEPQAKSALLIEPNSGKIIFEKNPDEKFAPASVTKIMTMLLAMEAIDSGRITLQDKIVCSEKVKSMGGSSMILDTGEVRTVEEILKGIAIASGNDAAVAMAEFLEGSEEAFVVKMNEKAAELGMTNTHFENCTGLSAEGHMSTARDIAAMSMALLKHPTILNYSSIYMETISEGRKTPIELVNHNKLVRFYKGCDGLKTGFTQEAMYCISATAVRDGVRMLGVIMGAPTFKQRNADVSKMMDFGFAKYQSKTIVEKDADVEQIPLDKKGESYYIAKACDDLKVTFEKGTENQITKQVIINPDLKKINAGDIVGKCEVYNGEELVGQVDLYSDREVKQSQFLNNLKNIFSKVFDHSI
ncbi:D-alanyl-D-alanine carboxypeptidase family protein [Clostridium culturomicium]|uniref:D-alanyl-D-alanine carboxypeptidase family protein n=1 Tax=Clostridium culturomicium TaxID=1499683 RepID=UPI00058FC3FB|nr:D-alanyl-D-alanine carboxypeptidase family protein [Clostridium culturomicium]